MLNQLIVIVLCLLVCFITCRPIKSRFHPARIAGGQPATQGQFPYAVYVQITKSDGVYQCTGGLISESAVLTAAHCVTGTSDATSISVVYGNINDTNVPAINLNYVSHYTYHPVYSATTSNNDVAVLHLYSPATTSNNVQPLTLSSTPPTVGQSYTAAGWGLIPSGTASDTLLYTTLSIVSDDNCATQESQGGFPYFPATQFCMNGGSPADTCEGDSGGPITQNVNGQWISYGLVSFGPEGNSHH
jgi:secreted trypsin-like serine protease